MKWIKLFLIISCLICGICFSVCGKKEKEETDVTGKTAELMFITIGKGASCIIKNVDVEN